MFFSKFLVFMLLRPCCIIATEAADCGSNPADIVFLLDSTEEYVSLDNFDKLKDFVSRFAQMFDIGPENVLIGVLTFDTIPHNEFNLNTYPDKTALVNNIHIIPYRAGELRTSVALKYVEANSFTTAAGDRAGVDNILIVMTGGQSYNPALTATEALKLQAMSVKVFAIGIGTGVDEEELGRIATDAQHVFQVQNFDALNTIQDELKNTVCKIRPASTSSTSIRTTLNGDISKFLTTTPATSMSTSTSGSSYNNTVRVNTFKTAKSVGPRVPSTPSTGAMHSGTNNVGITAKKNSGTNNVSTTAKIKSGTNKVGSTAKINLGTNNVVTTANINSVTNNVGTSTEINSVTNNVGTSARINSVANNKGTTSKDISSTGSTPADITSASTRKSVDLVTAVRLSKGTTTSRNGSVVPKTGGAGLIANVAEGVTSTYPVTPETNNEFRRDNKTHVIICLVIGSILLGLYLISIIVRRRTEDIPPNKLSRVQNQVKPMSVDDIEYV